MSEKQSIETLLAYSDRDMNAVNIANLLAAHESEKPPLKVSTPITIPKNHSLVGNTSEIKTTVGRFIFNVVVLERDLIQRIGFFNKTATKKEYEVLDKTLTNLMVEKKLEPERYTRYNDRLFWFVFTLAPSFAPSISYDLVSPNPKVIKRRDELFAKNRDAIAEGDVDTVMAIEAELGEMAMKELQDVAAADILRIGMKKPGMSQVKEMGIMRGAMPSRKGDGSFHISQSNLAEGIPWEEYPEYVNVAIRGTFSRSVATQHGGYDAKKVGAAGQAITFDIGGGSDCKTPRTLQVTIKNTKDYYLSYIMENGKPILLDSETISKYIGKTVELRSPMYCIHDNYKICSVCSGKFFEMTGINQPATTINRLGTNIMQIRMSAFHDSSVKTKKVDYNDFLS